MSDPRAGHGRRMARGGRFGPGSDRAAQEEAQVAGLGEFFEELAVPSARGRADDGLRAILRQRLPRAQWTTIETGAVAQGVPDCEYCFPGSPAGWVECKSTSAWALRFQPAQAGWLLRRARLGGVCWVAARRRGSAGGADYDELWVAHGRLVRRLVDGGLRAVQGDAWRWQGGPSAWDWAEVEAVLTGKHGY